jgi:hypothetical protein
LQIFQICFQSTFWEGIIIAIGHPDKRLKLAIFDYVTEFSYMVSTNASHADIDIVPHRVIFVGAPIHR